MILTTPLKRQRTDLFNGIGDNVDHNLATLDGKMTFHGMGVIAASTPLKYGQERVPNQDQDAQKLAEETSPELLVQTLPGTDSSEAGCERIEKSRPGSLCGDILWQYHGYH